MARSLNRVQLIGNLTRDPELRYTPTGAAVCTFGIATNRSWTTDTGEKKEEVEFHRLVAWNKLAELCSQLLAKGRKVFVEGRLAYRKYTKQDGTEQNVTEIVIDDMLVLDSKRGEAGEAEEHAAPAPKAEAKSAVKEETVSSEELADDIPF
ncbi:MAG TPA: single-stranded DNA-binding protein [Candidatus Saccharimonadales bacterium]|nr:single-stranded DNA-binding protein [Candidatus Saccharimonadales bacterium]